MSKSAAGYRKHYQDISGQTTIGAADGDTTLLTARSASHTIYIQTIEVFISTDAAQSWSFEDSASSPVALGSVPTSPGVGWRRVCDYEDSGLPLTEGKNLVLNVSAAGLAGRVKWTGYSKLTSAMAAGSGN